MFCSNIFGALCVLALTVAAKAQSDTSTAISTGTPPPRSHVPKWVYIRANIRPQIPERPALLCLQVRCFNSAIPVHISQLQIDVAYACQQSVLLVKEDTLAVPTGLQTWVRWQSTLHWVKDPPAHGPLPPVDLVGGLQELTEKVEDGTIAREIDFEWKLVDLLTSVHDGHFAFLPDAYFVFTFLNLQPIISLSTDGKQLPEIYLYNDLEPVSQGEGCEPSPIIKINGTEAVSWLSERALNGTMTFQDLDALYNGIFHSISAYSISAPLNQTVGYFALPDFSRFWGSSINLEFKNGSKSSIPIVAFTTKDFSNVIDGESFYQNFCNTTVKIMAAANGSSASTSQQISTTTPDSAQIPQYPSAIAISDDGPATF
ncbi:uncharacterized protein Z519_02400 [Cladophialophora bantiana CBS 173.52]|uniref:CPAF-like PDZ domain-containing protein n=1 Tax=Cladophialophora bantiana (strain ATCC 10958 / CBS 173.52 / CDC B-1940 / NIH 8579) TaxID=1442370 RepID=A0A0D2IJT9_CLAB1|nr:uncharacterized protein Z519_02400 [Cladophialophora bantiana CBS 173.52]KIW97009.1 hypothetical protein Z519_02400 [Cladophialophora bantiana CBS 173.52]